MLKSYITKNRISILKQIVAIVTFCFGVFSYGQQDAQYTQYMYNTVSVNPGYAGSRGHISIAALHRSQWVGLGFSIVNDEIGPTSETNFDIDFSYTIYTSTEGRLSFGLKASANLLDIKFSELNQYSTDPTLQQDIDNRLSPNIGAGVYYHTNKFYLGLSVPRFLETSHFQETNLSTAKEQMNLYLISGYVWDLNDFVKFKPTILTKVVLGAPVQLDVSANFMLNDKFIIGAGYRWDAAISAMAGFNISNKFLIGIAYDKETTELGNAAFNDGSFEVIFRYDFISTKNNLKSPRFF
jgi:type IX secretion system PorP/SprF family membrane protein